MATIQLPPDFHDFLSLLNRHSVEYLLIGGYAVNLYGFVRATGDMDVFIALNPDNVSRIVAAFHEFGVGSMTAEALQPGKIIRLGVPPMRLEVLNRISGVTFAEAYATREVKELNGLGHVPSNSRTVGTEPPVRPFPGTRLSSYSRWSD